ncbi:MAG: hypothetical protein ACRC6V_10675 [Bacteroidales bacterium]
MEPKNTITFRIGDETRPILEDKNLKESIFFDLYQKSFVEIDKYIAKVETLKDEANGYKYEGINNLFAFIGERGAGKSSCMMSVGRILEKGESDIYKELELTNKVDGILKHKFINSILIDPSFFDQQNNILSLIIAHLFKTFRDKVSDTNCKIDIDKKRKVIDSFERVQRNLKHFFEFDKSNTDSLDSLVNFAATVDLQNDIKSLIDSYLDFISDDKNGFLVLMIDDIDLHTEHARDMVEQVRKYFIQPNVIVLMAVKIDQLSNVIKNNLSKEYKVLIDNKAIDFDVINEMVERYLGKLIPHSHRIYLPDATVLYNKGLELIVSNEAKDNRLYNTVREGILSLIYEKTSYLFYNTKSTTNIIIPRNLRELRQIITLLINMKSIDNSTTPVIYSNKYNQEQFITYFKETWANKNLSGDAIIFIGELFDIVDPLLINKKVIDYLAHYYKEYISNLSTKEANNSELFRILNPRNKVYNISIGDVLYIIRVIQNITYRDYDIKLLFAIKTFYTFKLNEFLEKSYEVTDSGLITETTIEKDHLSIFSDMEKIISGGYIETRNNDIIDNTTIKVISKPLYISKEVDEDLVKKVSTLVSKVSPLTRKNNHTEITNLWNDYNDTSINISRSDLIYKSFYNGFIVSYNKGYHGFYSLKRFVNNTSNSIIYREMLKQIIEEFENNVSFKMVSRSITIIDCDDVTNLRDEKSLPILEIILSCISKRANDNDLSFREKEEVRFNGNFKATNLKNIYFDIYAPFYNLLDIKKCYQRFELSILDRLDNEFDEFDLFKYSLRSEESLISRILNKLKVEYPESMPIIEDFTRLQRCINSRKNNKNKASEFKEIFSKYIDQVTPTSLDKSNISSEDLMNEVDLLLEHLYNLTQPWMKAWVTINNIEFLESLTTKINSSKDKLKYNGSELALYRTYFDTISNFSTPKYKIDNEEHLSINLGFMSAYSDILKIEIERSKNDNTYQSLFESIFTPYCTENRYNTLYDVK